ncbi:MAG: hypothetical protein A2583_11325 [Bdellovibrionales bacterium RIFOXYD1_FULL_53_11]|nr:MAG: hypothetical protein A2583_11325 [Bdellovibrionales bacterium RIFOXYD1_FULL_53_11]
MAGSSMRGQTEKILAKARQMAPLSHSIVKLMQMIDDGRHGAHEVARVVSHDEVLAAGVLRVVNSTAFGLKQKITDVERAVGYLGDKMVLGIAVGSGLTVFDRELEGYCASRGALWKHSLCAAIAAREISAYAVIPVKPGEAFTAGLIHDIGKVVISGFLQQKIDWNRKRDGLEEKPCGNRADFVKFERQLLGTDHCEIGAAVAVRWNLPAQLVSLLQNHHEPSRAGENERVMAYVVHLADVVAMMAGHGTGVDSFRYVLDPLYKEYVKINRKQIESIVFATGLDFERVREGFVSNKDGGGG